jgi:hypothetical protein
MSNLYSILAKKGRLGDNALRYVGGELSHVNSQEAAIIDKYGTKGEAFVEEYGSGTINSETGLKEYGVTIAGTIAAINAGKALWDIGSSIFGGKNKEDRNNRMNALLNNQEYKLNQSRRDIGDREEILLEQAFEGGELREENEFVSFLKQSENINTKSDEAISGGNLAFSGGIMEALNKERNKASTDFQTEMEAQDLKLEKETGNILSESARLNADIDTALISLDTQRTQYS